MVGPKFSNKSEDFSISVKFHFQACCPDITIFSMVFYFKATKFNLKVGIYLRPLYDFPHVNSDLLNVSFLYSFLPCLYYPSFL